LTYDNCNTTIDGGGGGGGDDDNVYGLIWMCYIPFKSRSSIYTWSMPFAAYYLGQSNTYTFTIGIKALCSSMPRVRVGLKHLSYQNSSFVTTGPPSEYTSYSYVP